MKKPSGIFSVFYFNFLVDCRIKRAATKKYNAINAKNAINSINAKRR